METIIIMTNPPGSWNLHVRIAHSTQTIMIESKNEMNNITPIANDSVKVVGDCIKEYIG